MSQDEIDNQVDSTNNSLSITDFKKDATQSTIAPAPQQSRPLNWWWILVGLAAVGGTSFALLQPLQEKNQGETKIEEAVRILPVKVMTANRTQSYQRTRTYTGEVIAQRSSDLGLERSGTLTKIHVDEGDQVKAGQILAELDTQGLLAQKQELNAQLSQEQARLAELRSGPRPETIAAARANIRQLEAQLGLAQARLTRRETLYQEGAIAREQFDEVNSSVQSLQAELDAAQSNLEELLAGTRSEQIQAQEAVVKQLQASLASLAVDLNKSTLKAPFRGTVDNRLVDEGTVISPGEPILRLIEYGALEAQVGVPVDQVASLKVGHSQEVRIGGQTYTAPITAILPTLEESTRTAIVVLQLDPSVSATPEQLVEMELQETVEAEGFWLPTTALVPSVQGLWSVFVLSPNPVSAKDINSDAVDTSNVYQVEKRDVEIVDTKGDRVLVKGTLQSGEQAITSGIHKITLGQFVRPATR